MKNVALITLTFAVLTNFATAAPPTTAPAATQPAAIFWPLDAKRIIFISDCTGSMMQTFDPLRAEMRKAVELLRPDQRFNILFMGETVAEMLSRTDLLPATKENKAKVPDWLGGIAPRGTTTPDPALRLAFAQKPDVIFLLTDGDFDDNERVLRLVRTLNRDQKVKVSTIGFFSDGESCEKMLRQIAKENGGTYRHVNEESFAR